MCHLIQSSPNETGAILICILSGKTEAQWSLTWPMSHNWKAAVFHREFQSTSFPSPHFSSLHHIVMPYNFQLIQFIIRTLVNHTSSLSHGADIFIGGGAVKVIRNYLIWGRSPFGGMLSFRKWLFPNMPIVPNYRYTYKRKFFLS